MGEVAEERISVASQWQLMWWRFRKHKLAMISAVIVILFYGMVVLADFLAYADPEVSDAQRGLIAPQPIVWFDPDTGGWFPHVPGLVGKRDPLTFKRVYAVDPTVKVPITFFAEGFDYKLFGFIPANRHLIGPADGGNPATITEHEFLGAVSRYRMRMGRHEIVADVPHQRGVQTHAPGAMVGLTIDPRQVAVLR